jgi:hypothetical protein
MADVRAAPSLITADISRYPSAKGRQLIAQLLVATGLRGPWGDTQVPPLDLPTAAAWATVPALPGRRRTTFDVSVASPSDGLSLRLARTMFRAPQGWVSQDGGAGARGPDLSAGSCMRCCLGATPAVSVEIMKEGHR